MKSSCILTGLALAVILQGRASDADPVKEPEFGRPNVLFFLVDDLRPTLGCYGDVYARAPNIDSLAARGTVFSHAYCQQAVSNPSRASMLTGLRPDENGVTDLNTHFRERGPDAVTIPQFFKQQGYYTAGAGKVFHSGGKMSDGISWTESSSAYDRREYITEPNMTPNARKTSSFERADVPDNAYPDGIIADDAIAFLQKASEKDTPFFLAVGFKKPHLPFCAPEKYWDLYSGVHFSIPDMERPAGSPDVAFHNWNELRGYTDIPDEGPLTYEKQQELLWGYYVCVSYMDAQLGKVMGSLHELGLAENTIIVLWGDNGFHLGEQDLWCKSTNFESDTRIPLIISAPVQDARGGECSAIVESVDLYPTLIELCGQQPGEMLSGRSLVPLLDDPTEAWDHPAFSQFPRPYEAITRPVATTMGYSVRIPGWRCTYWYDLKTGEVTDRELYKMDDDYMEKENLSGREEYRLVEEKLSAYLNDYRNGIYNKK